MKPKTTIIVGLDGKLESLVAAYLLKKQGHRVIGVTVSFKSKDEEVNEIMKPWMPEDIDLIKSYCDKMEISYYATDASGEFFDVVVDKLVGARLSGVRFNPLQDFNKLVITKLVEKKEVLSADYIATGHFAKIYKNQITGEFVLLTSNDIENDESFSVSSLPHSLYEHVIFPLSDLRREEMTKIFDLVGIKLEREYQNIKKNRRDFDLKDEINELVKKFAAPSLIKDGVVYSWYDGKTYGDHENHYQFHMLQHKMPFKPSQPLEKDLVVVKMAPSTGAIFVDREEKLIFDHAILHRFVCDENLDKSKPLSCFVKFTTEGEKHPVTLSFKNNGHVLVKFSEEQKGILTRGISATFYTRSGANSRILGSARVLSCGVYDQDEYRYLPKTKDEEDVVKNVLVDMFHMRF